MKRFHCACGQRVFFDNTRCLVCDRRLGFDPERLDVLTLEPVDTKHDTASGTFMTTGGVAVRLCRNTREFGNCNWLIPAESPAELCLSCGLDEVIPNLGVPGNIELWTKVEQAKRRLLYTLLTLGLSVTAGAGRPGLRFRFLEDQRRNPDVGEDFVLTGHLEGIVTVNLAEADDAVRNELREAFQERYRTVLGHLRHEAGHYYFKSLTSEPEDLDAFRSLFGDERKAYGAALSEYYANGPRPDWSWWHFSAYASAHPHEDFAETFAHYLHIVDALETAEEAGFDGTEGDAGWIDRWKDLAVTLNELNRSLGADDPYPFVLSGPVVEKLELIDRLVRRRA